VLSPVTRLAGPQAALTLLLTLGFAGSAASLFLVLRRWDASLTAAAIGGAVYGFSPAMVNTGIAHFQLQFAVLPPLMIDALLRLVTGRGRPVWNGVWLGVLAAAQLFTGEEMLADTALAGLVIVAVLALGHPRAVPGRVRGAATGLVTGAAVMLAISWHGLWVQFFGPLTQHNTPQGADPFRASFSGFVNPSAGVLFHTAASLHASVLPVRFATKSIMEYLAYLGWPLLVLLVFATIRFWRDPRVRAAAVTWLALEVCSLGGGGLTYGGFRFPGDLLPFHWLQGAPVFSQVLPNRLAILSGGAAAAVLAFSLDAARSPARRGRADWPRRTIPIAVVVLAILPIIPLPYQTVPVTPAPAGWQAAFARLHLAPGARVVVVPVSAAGFTQAMRWQAETGEPATMNGGYFVGPNPQTGQQMLNIPGPSLSAGWYLDGLWSGKPIRPLQYQSRRRLRADFAYWRPAAVVAFTTPGSPLARVMTADFGRPTFAVGAVLVWRFEPYPRVAA
jgi:hypothetical protein